VWVVIGRARQMQDALDAGLPRSCAAVLAAAGATWRRTGQVSLSPDLVEAVTHPAAPLVDEVLVAAVRRRLRRA
jgi:hypothetical protein